MAAISRNGEKLLNTFVSMGAAVVIFGAWQKILHASLADLFLTIGLLTEAAIFAVYGFLALRGYGLDDHGHGHAKKAMEAPKVSLAQGGVIPQLPADQIANLQQNIAKLGAVAQQLQDLSGAVRASQNFGEQVNKAAGAFVAVGKMVEDTSKSMISFKKAADQLGGMGDQTKQLSQNLTALNQVYHDEIANSSKGLKSIGAFYDNLSSVAKSLQDSVKEAESAKKEIANLAGNLSQLNAIYGNMISAMKK